ncbi:17260_t:CDS:1, partial [Gigaspora rosea]
IAYQIQIGRNSNLYTQTMWEIQQIFRDHHAFYPKYQQAFEILSQARQDGASETDLAVHLHFNAATDHRRYNLHTTNEIAVILPGDDFVLERMRNIILHLCG